MRGGARREEGEERGGKEKDAKEKGGGCPKLCDLHPWAHRAEEGTQLCYSIQDHTNRGREGFLAKLPLTNVKCSL